MKSKKWITIIILAALSILIEAILMPIRAINLNYSAVIGFFLFGAYTSSALKIVKNLKPLLVVSAIAIGLLVIHLPFRIPYWRATLVTLPDALMHLLGIGLGYLFWNVGIRAKLLLVAPLSVLLSVGYHHGFKMFLNKLNHDTWTGKIAPVPFPVPLDLLDGKGRAVNLDHFKGNYLVLDFWTSTCGLCIKAFPDVQACYDKFKTSGTKVFSIHCRHEDKGENNNTGENMIAKRGFTFPCLSIGIDDPALKAIGIYSFPAVLILDPDSKIIFRGEIEKAAQHLENIQKKAANKQTR